MKTIWKWTIGAETIIDMPLGAKILDVQDQRGDFMMWALVDPDNQTAPRRFVLYGTGHDLTNNPGEYIGTVQMDRLVFHVFEVRMGKTL